MLKQSVRPYSVQEAPDKGAFCILRVFGLCSGKCLPLARHLSAEVQTGALASLAAHAARVRQLVEARAVTQSTLVAIASACHTHAEHLHLPLVAPAPKAGTDKTQSATKDARPSSQDPQTVWHLLYYSLGRTTIYRGVALFLPYEAILLTDGPPQPKNSPLSLGFH